MGSVYDSSWDLTYIWGLRLTGDVFRIKIQRETPTSWSLTASRGELIKSLTELEESISCK